MVSALALAYTFSHDAEKPQKAVALLQTEQGALALSPSHIALPCAELTLGSGGQTPSTFVQRML